MQARAVTWRSRDSVVNIVPGLQAGRPRNHSIPSFSKPSRLVLGHAAFCSLDTIGSFTEIKQPRREADHLGERRVEYLCSHPEEAGGKRQVDVLTRDSLNTGMV